MPENFIYENNMLRYEFRNNDFSKDLYKGFNHKATELGLNLKIDDLLSGKDVNLSENQAAFHPKYRKNKGFINEFIKREKKWLNSGGKFILPYPKFKILSAPLEGGVKPRCTPPNKLKPLISPMKPMPGSITEVVLSKYVEPARRSTRSCSKSSNLTPGLMLKFLRSIDSVMNPLNAIVS